MTEIAASQDSPLSIRGGVPAWSARRNRETQRRLFGRIAEVSRRDPAEVAEALGVDETSLAAIVRGETDLSMTELRLLSIACDVVIDYRVTSTADDMDSHAQVLLRALKSEIEAERPWSGRSAPFAGMRWIKT
ncbi:XRE family transcriptional regulator [Microbacterium sp. 3H14]|uniref:helix-turn-helix domain-containing protein n=1 Tax=Microbacterium sp. IO18 TaxID=3390997 RepID=UPI00106982A5|nr:XRE family transcriptional regulator [Microbacterium sp. 3H14]